jgi:hypothetical protein
MSNDVPNPRTTAADRSVAAEGADKGASTRVADLARYLASAKQGADTAQRHGPAAAVEGSTTTGSPRDHGPARGTMQSDSPRTPIAVLAQAGPDAVSRLAAHGISLDSLHDKSGDAGHKPVVDVGFGPPGPTDKRAALAGSPVYDVQVRLEGAGLSQQRIEDVRQHLLADPASLGELTDGMANRGVRELLLDFAESGQQDWRRYIPPAARVDALMHQALGRAPGEYLSQRDLDELTQAVGFRPAQLHGRGLSEHDITDVRRYLTHTRRLPYSNNADPVALTRDGRVMPASDAVVHERERYTAAARESPVVFESVRSATGDVENAEAAGAMAKLVVEAAGHALHQYHTAEKPAVVRTDRDRQ